MGKIKLIISELRKEYGLTQAELADHLGVSYQSVSKWENGTSMPDIALLPDIAEYFKVTVDELLGLTPLSNREYRATGKDTREYWNSQLEYLKASRVGFWNNDYLEFLVDKVWKITKPINIADFGCGYGYLGKILLPLLPKGSTYTGIDVSEKLIEEGQNIFTDSEYNVEFINCDLNKFDVKNKYDVAICQALLRHITNPKEILSKMVEAIVPGGKVITIDVNREFEQAGLYIDGLDYNSFGITSILQKLWKTELLSEGRDYSVGIKIPFYMQELGLKDIDIRVNDRVNFANPYGDRKHYDSLISALIKTNNWDNPLSDKEKEATISLFMNRGLTRSEAECYVRSQDEIHSFITTNKQTAFLLKTLCLLISFGTK